MEINLPLTKLLVEGNNCFYLILNTSGVVRFANKLFLKTIASQQEVIDNSSFHEFVTANQKQNVEDLFKKLLAKKDKIASLEIEHPTLSGKAVTIKWDCVVKTENQETQVHCLGIAKATSASDTLQITAPDKASELKALNVSLSKRVAELASSNEELERFAYVASHDLQEPLRMVSSFLQLLQKRYHEKLDSKANEYIHFAVDGAERMKTLILDLLKFSRVNTSVDEHELIDLNEICENVLITYKQTIAKNNAAINVGALPAILGSKTELMQLFQNLIGNALKYRSEQPPVVDIDVTDADAFWQFSIADNGIGIDPRFYKKIFVIFQRLHHKNEYSGTGIGLAICKKIIERHGGKIWVESKPGTGSTFYFTLPKHKSEHSKERSRTSEAI